MKTRSCMLWCVLKWTGMKTRSHNVTGNAVILRETMLRWASRQNKPRVGFDTALRVDDRKGASRSVAKMLRLRHESGKLNRKKGDKIGKESSSA